MWNKRNGSAVWKRRGGIAICRRQKARGNWNLGIHCWSSTGTWFTIKQFRNERLKVTVPFGWHWWLGVLLLCSIPKWWVKLTLVSAILWELTTFAFLLFRLYLKRPWCQMETFTLMYVWNTGHYWGMVWFVKELKFKEKNVFQLNSWLSLLLKKFSYYKVACQNARGRICEPL